DEPDQDTRRKAYLWCREFLHGSWRSLHESDFKISIIRYRLYMVVHACAVMPSIVVHGDVPPWLYMHVFFAVGFPKMSCNKGDSRQSNKENHYQGAEAMVLESVMFAILAERELGPKLYGIFPQGRLEQYIPSRKLDTWELSDPSISAEVAEKMAKFHGMRMPFNKEPKWLFGTMEKYLSQVMRLKCTKDSHLRRFNRLLSYNLPQELEMLRRLEYYTKNNLVCPKKQCKSHLFVLDKLRHTQKPPALRMGTILSPYIRGFDIGNHFCEWMYNYSCNEFPFFKVNPQAYPSKAQQLHFIENYLRESEPGFDNLCAGDQLTMKEGLYIEVNRFSLVSHFFWGLWSIIQARISTIEFGYLEYAQARFDAYFQQKKIWAV
uniref:ethanolamine kinase n=1 Tax=Tetraodon nigroviridis TaxID=99883 RepID=H3CBB7_TETNG